MKTYHGSCFCGAVAFEADGDLAEGTMRCNCRFCRKMRYWEFRLPSPSDLRLSQGKEFLKETPLSPGHEQAEMHHVFCGRCGTRLWTSGEIAEMGGAVMLVCVNALDDATVEELVQAPLHISNGAEDDWWNPAPESRHL